MHPVLNHWWQQNRPRFIYLTMYNETHAILLVPDPVQDALLHIGEVVGNLPLAAKAITCTDCFRELRTAACKRINEVDTREFFDACLESLTTIGLAREAMDREVAPCLN